MNLMLPDDTDIYDAEKLLEKIIKYFPKIVRQTLEAKVNLNNEISMGIEGLTKIILDIKSLFKKGIEAIKEGKTLGKEATSYLDEETSLLDKLKKNIELMLKDEENIFELDMARYGLNEIMVKRN